MRMKYFVSIALTVALMPVAVATAAAQAVDNRPGLAVFPFENGASFGPDREDLTGLEVGVQQIVLTELAQNENLRVVERSQLRAILDEQGLVTSGRVDPSTAARIGRLVGARYVITGGFVDWFGDFQLNGRIINVETGEVMKAIGMVDQKENLYRMLVDLAGQITEGVSLPPLQVAVVQQRRAREIPAEALTLFSHAQVLQDGGREEQAIELYQQISQRFPEMTEARDALRQLTEG